MHFNISGLALSILGMCFIYLPFVYKKALDDGHGHVGAFWSMALFYIIFFLWVGGAACFIYGIGLVFDRPSQFCGSGCIEQGESHWESPRIAFLLLGGSMMLVGWYVGKGMERFDEWLIARKCAAKIRSRGTAIAPLNEAMQEVSDRPVTKSSVKDEHIDDGYPTREQIEEVFYAWKRNGKEGILEVIKKRRTKQKERDSVIVPSPMSALHLKNNEDTVAHSNQRTMDE